MLQEKGGQEPVVRKKLKFKVSVNLSLKFSIAEAMFIALLCKEEVTKLYLKKVFENYMG